MKQKLVVRDRIYVLNENCLPFRFTMPALVHSEEIVAERTKNLSYMGEPPDILAESMDIKYNSFEFISHLLFV